MLATRDLAVKSSKQEGKWHSRTREEPQRPACGHREDRCACIALTSARAQFELLRQSLSVV